MEKTTKVIGVTGGAGSGKSEVLRLLKENYGAFVILADDVSRALSAPGAVSYCKIVDFFGENILCKDQTIDRKKLASVVFHDPKLLEKLNSMTHPDVRVEIERLICQAKAQGYPFVVVEAALLIEGGYRDLCDEFWYIYTKESIRRQRMKETRGYTDEKIDAVLKNQLDEDAFRSACDRVIENNTTLAAVEAQLKHVIESYKKI